MSKYIHLYETVSAYTDERINNYYEPWLSYTKEDSEVNYNKTEEEKQLETPLTFDILSDGYINWKASNTAITRTIEYSKDSGETWTEVTSSTGGTQIGVSSGDTVLFRGNNNNYANSSNYNTFSGTTCQFNVKGNIMSLISSTGFADLTTLNSAYTFSNLFYFCTGLTNANYLLLPATTLGSFCYERMFRGCTSLTTIPELPATTLANYCYREMFRDCTGLVSAPSSIGTNQTVMAGNSCQNMFWGCTSLVTAPELPATTLASNCYQEMFYNCTSLVSASELRATTLAGSCYREMFYNCTSLVSAPELPATTLAGRCYDSMFASCTSLTTAPELPATTLAGYCYNGMFAGCTSLTTAPELPATTLVSDCYSFMFSGCTSLTTAPELPATTLDGNCYNSMFWGCTSLVTAPELPATTLANWCYVEMFFGCSNLSYIKCLATDISASNCTFNWVNVVASTGTFVAYDSSVAWTTGESGIPTNWTVEYVAAGTGSGGDPEED